MKKISLILSTLCLGLALSAQPGIISTRPANSQDGKTLTMEETILSRELSPANIWASWEDSENILMHKDGKWQKYDINTGNYADFAGIRRPSIEALTKDRSLYLVYADGTEKLIAQSENKNITYGEFVSRNEFGISNGIFWSPDSTKVAFYRKDESAVTSFPLLDITTRTGSLKEIKYPMAGMDSENVQLGIYDVASGKTIYVQADDFGHDRYLTNISWAPDERVVYILVLDRSQKHLRLNAYCSDTGEYIKTILTEDSDKYVEPVDPLHFVAGYNDIFIYRTANRDGFRNLYLCDNAGNIRRLTSIDADVKYVGNDGRFVYYTSAEVSPIENHLFRIEIKNLKKGILKARTGQPERLTLEEGWHDIALSPDGRYFLDSYTSLCTPRVVNICKSDGKVIKNLLTAEDPTLDYAYTEISLGTVKSADGLYDNYYRIIKPKDFDPTKKYPVIVYVYGGPHSQMVQNTFMGQLRRWEMYMAQRGYLVYVQDNRGTENRGLAFEQAIHGQCGQAEMADQMEGVKMLMELPYIDKDRIGVHGWSYGGFMTISLITNYPDVFKVGVAGGPVIDWKWYEVMYGERYMDHPDVNPDGYARTSLINKAKDLKGKLLICQGAIDPVVVWEHSLSFIRECIKNNVQVDYFPYPCAEHNVMGKDRVHLHDKISMYFEDYL
ncbi:MAG: DPP IV N-terminal domain-containing protein [Bacteroidales bacterium]|nr:DPP IV N-terminal domain-containing protein [Bacteroidales bacterium]